MKALATDSWRAVLEARALTPTSPAWLTSRRQEALEAFQTQGYPTQRLEAWRTTNVGPIARTPWTDAAWPDPATLARARRCLADLPRPGVETARFVLVNGHLVPSLSVAPPVPGLEGASLAGKAASLEGRLGRLADPSAHPFAALNAALWPDGLFLEIARGVPIEAPVHVVLLSLGGPLPVAAHPRLFVLAQEGSRAALLLTWAGEGEGAFLSNGVAEVWLEAGARLDWLEVQRQPLTAYHVWNAAVHQAQGSRFHACCLALGGRLVRADLGVTLDAEGAQCRLDGITLARGRQHVDVRTNVDHARPHGESQQLFKSILDDHATAAFSGRVLVRPDAQKTDARQANHNLLLSRDARAESKPELEIRADDVKCGHGATVGQLDEESLFYLRSRGIDLEAARAMLVRAFANDVADRIVHEALATHAHAVIETALGGGARTPS